MKMQSKPTDQVMKSNLFSLVLELIQHPWKFITEMERVSWNLLLTVLEALLSVFKVQQIADRRALH